MQCNLVRHGKAFGLLDRRHQDRYWKLVSEHAHAVNALVSGISSLPGAAQPLAAARAITRFLNHRGLPFAALIEPARDAVRSALLGSPGRFALVVHDWCMFPFGRHAAKRDRYRRSHDNDIGYELGSALVVDASDGRPLGPVEFRPRTADGTLSTRPGDVPKPPGHVEELAAVMAAAAGWDLGREPVHVVDREADSVGDYRHWHAAGRLFLVRADGDRLLLHGGRQRQLAEVAAGLLGEFADVPGPDGGPTLVATRAGTGRLRVAEAAVVPHRPARRNTGERTAAGHKRQVEVPGPPLPLRLVVTRVVGELGTVLAEWRLLSNVDGRDADAATIGRWYAWRWRIELFFRWLKCELGSRHLIAHNRNGVTIQMYAALIVSLLIVLRTGRKPTKRTFEMIQYHLPGWVSDEEFDAHLAALSAAKKKR